MAQLLLVNPKKRGRTKMARRKRRTAAQRAATRKLVAANRRRRRNPNNNNANATVRRRARPGRRPTMRTYVSNPRRKRRVRRRRNPNGGRITMRNVMNRNVMPAFQGASGGLLLDVLWGYIPTPATPGGFNLKTGQLRHVIKGAGAIGMGMLASQFVRPATATALTTGALTTVMHTAMREMLAQFAPNIPLGAYMEQVPYGTSMTPMGYYSAGQIESPQYNNLGQNNYNYGNNNMSEYMGPDDANMGMYETGVEGDLMGMGVGVYE